MTAKQLAEVCAKITINLISGGVPLELAMDGVKGKLFELYNQHKSVADDEARRDLVAKDLEKEFAFCL